jgi:hypothetical protein
MKSIRTVGVSLLFVLLPSLPALAQSWTAKLDKDIRFYQPTEMGVLIVGTEKSLYAIDASTGETVWHRKDTSLDETDIAPVPGTDLLLLSFEKGDKARIEAVDILTGDSLWRSEKIKGAVMQTSVDPEFTGRRTCEGREESRARRFQAPSTLARSRFGDGRRALEVRHWRGRDDAGAVAGRFG